MPLPESPVSRQRLHVRRIVYEGWQREDGLFDIEARLVDAKDHDYDAGVRRRAVRGMPVHDMSARVTIDGQFVIRAIVASSDGVPVPGRLRAHRADVRRSSSERT